MRIVAPLLIAASIPVLLGMTCSTPERLLPSRLDAPSAVTVEITGIKLQGTVREALHVQWSAVHSDSIDVSEYCVLRKLPEDSLFRLIVDRIPDSITDFYDPIGNNIVFPGSGATKLVKYKTYAIDELGRAGDTSATTSINLAWQVRNLSQADSSSRPRLTWTVSHVQGPFYTYLMVWDSTKLIWKAPRPFIPTSFGSETSTFTASGSLPDSIPVLGTGRYFFGVILELTDESKSISVGEFYVKNP